MNRVVMFLFSLVLLASIVPAWGADPSPAYEQLKPLQWQLGNWVTEYQAAADSGPIKKGDPVTVRFSIRWSPDHSYLVNNSFSEVSGKRVATSMEVISWNYEKSAIAHSYYGTWGMGEGVWTKVGDTPELEWTIHGQYGTFTGTSYGAKGDDSWQWQIREQTHDGKKMPDMPLATFRRETGQAAGDLWTAYRNAALGTWNGQGVLRDDFGDLPIAKGDKFTMQFTLRPELDGKAAVGETVFQVVGKPFTTNCRVLAGWDPDARQIRFTALRDGELVEEIVLSGR